MAKQENDEWVCVRAVRQSMFHLICGDLWFLEGEGGRVERNVQEAYTRTQEIYSSNTVLKEGLKESVGRSSWSERERWV